jgi:hypothetical protein
MNFKMYSPVEKQTNEAKHPKKSKKENFSNMLDSVVVEHDHQLVWQQRDGKQYMHAFSFAKQDLKKDSPSVVRIS